MTRAEAIEILENELRCVKNKTCDRGECRKCPLVMAEDDIRDALELAINQLRRAADVVSVVRCKDCKHRILNKHYGEKGYMNLKAECDLDTGDPYQLGRNAEDDDWFCADGERKGKTDDVE